MWIDRSVWLIWIWFVWPLGLYGSCATPLLTSSSVIKSVVISTTSSVHKLQTAAFSHVIVPAWVVSCARSRISWQCTWIWNKLMFGSPHTMANILRLWRYFEIHWDFEESILDKDISTLYNHIQCRQALDKLCRKPCLILFGILAGAYTFYKEFNFRGAYTISLFSRHQTISQASQGVEVDDWQLMPGKI